MRKLAVVCVVLVLGCGLMGGCSFFQKEGQQAAQKTQPGRERVSEGTQQLVKQLQQKVDQLEAEVMDLQHQVETKAGSN